MADGLSLVLWSLAEYFNYFSVTLIILCLGLMTAFIIRLNGDQWGRYNNGGNQGESSLAYQKDVTAFSNPFFLKLSTAAASNLKDGVRVQMSCLEPCEVRVYWGARISPVHAALLKAGTDLLEDMRTDALLSGDCLATERHRLGREGKHSMHYSTPEEVDGDKLGPPQRQRYPCVVVMATRNSSSIAEHTSVVAMVSILHLKDGQCAMDTHIIAQYAKMAGPAVYNLQPLFFASELEEGSGVTSSQLDDSANSSSAGETGAYNNQSTNTTPPTSTHILDRDGDSKNGENAPSSATTTSSSSHSNPHSLNLSGSTEHGDREHDFYCQRQDSSWENTFPECIVCQSQPLNCALLPCRHTCVCRVCFHKLDRCPMCRSHIESYFTLCDEDDEDEVGAGSVPDEPVPLDLYSRFERFNQRLNHLLGVN